MYNLPYFKEPDELLILRLIEEHPFALVSGCDAENHPVATQVPLLLEERNGHYFLSGHIMKQTDHYQAFINNPEVLAVFTGPHAYVSATWYSNPHQASTWNYLSVHARGHIRFTDDAGLVAALKKLTLRFEGGDTTSPTVFDNLDAAYSGPLLKAIAAFEIEVRQLNHVFKLSQNKDARSYFNIIDKLMSQGGDAAALAEAMSQRATRLFGDEPEADKQ